MSALLDSLATGVQIDVTRSALLAAAIQDGLPHPRSEAWKYTSLRALERRVFVPSAQVIADFDASLLDDIPAPRLVFVNGRFDARHSDISELPDEIQFEAVIPALDAADVVANTDSIFVRLNAVLATTGLSLRVAANTSAAVPLHLVNIGAGTGKDHAWHLRHRLEVASGANIHLIEHHLASGAHRHLDNSVLTLNIAEDARLLHTRIQASSDHATCLLRTEGQLHARAQYVRVDLELGGGLVRHELNIQLVGDAASLIANGVSLATGRRHLETRLGITHHARDTRCNLLWRGIGAGRGRVVFHGGITIAPGADGTEAGLSSKNLLLSEHAEIDTQPVLVIHADEVQAAHGATVGQLDANALFYLRARGLPLPEARRLLTAAFVREPLLPLADNASGVDIQHRLDHAINTLT